MSQGSVYASILIMAAVTYLIRMLPLTLIRKPIKSRFVRSFLYYVPFATLTVMTFPAILTDAGSPWAGLAALATATALAWKKKGLILVALAACTVAFLVNLAAA